MADIAGIRFKSCGKIYDFDISGLDVRKGDTVIVESEFGLSIGNIVEINRNIENYTKELKKVVRVAGNDDLKKKKDNEAFEKEARDFCYKRIAERGLPMKLVCSEATLDKKRIVFYFTADGRIDFRELVKDLASKFKTRIEMRQIGVRDKAKLVGGLSICGKELCCRLFLTSFEPISIKMAKQQDLSLNAGKLSGTCGRLMCCLGFEYNDERSEAAARVREKAAPAPAHETAAEKEDEPAEEIEPLEEAAPEAAIETADHTQAAAATDKADQSPEGARKKRRRRRFRKRPPKNE